MKDLTTRRMHANAFVGIVLTRIFELIKNHFEWVTYDRATIKRRRGG